MNRDVVVSSVIGRPFRQEIQAGDTPFASDEPIDMGGEGSAPKPYDLLLGALGSCTSMTMGMYARRKGWPLEQVRVTLRHERIKAADCDDCDRSDPEALVDIFERHIEISGPLDDDQRVKLLEIANKCPLHRTLTGVIRIRTDLSHLE